MEAFDECQGMLLEFLFKRLGVVLGNLSDLELFANLPVEVNYYASSCKRVFQKGLVLSGLG